MKIRWSAEAAADLEAILRRIREDNPTAASRTVRKVYDGVMALKKFPKRGRPGWVQGSRELVLSPLPYVVMYRVKGPIIEISRIYHGAQNWLN
jgi:toxin ParE1/3/4